MAEEARSLSPEELEPVTPQQERFCEEYLIDLNGTQAAIRAGYSPASAGQQACDLLKVPKIRARIDIALAERSKRTGITADRVLRELARLAFVNPLDVIDAASAEVREEADDNDSAAILSVKVKTIPQKGDDPIVEREIRMADKIKALDLLGKHLGILAEKHEHTGKDGGPIQIAGRVQGLSTAELQALLVEREKPETGGGK